MKRNHCVCTVALLLFAAAAQAQTDHGGTNVTWANQTVSGVHFNINTLTINDTVTVADEVALMVSQTCKVLQEAHDLGVVHRDIKPDNLFLTDSGYDMFVKVLDFGVAKQTGLPQKSSSVS